MCLYNSRINITTHLCPGPGLTEAMLSATQSCEHRLKSSADNMQVSVLLKLIVWMSISQNKLGVVMSNRPVCTEDERARSVRLPQ